MARVFTQAEAKQLGLSGRKALEIVSGERGSRGVTLRLAEIPVPQPGETPRGPQDRKSTRLNSSHGYISYAVFCLKKKKHDGHPRPLQATPSAPLLPPVAGLPHAPPAALRRTPACHPSRSAIPHTARRD